MAVLKKGQKIETRYITITEDEYESFKKRSKKDMKIDLPVNIEISNLTKKSA